MSKKCINSLMSGSRRKLFYFIFILLSLVAPSSAFSQWTEYTIVGRVVDENRVPVAGARVRVAPIEYMMQYAVTTDEDGRFSLNKEIKKGDIWYLYVSQYLDEDAAQTKHVIYAPFFGVNVKNKNFLGKPLRFGSKKVVDVGDVNVQFRFYTAYLKFQINNRNLRQKEWEALWCRIKDEKGNILAQSSIGPAPEEKGVDLSRSVLMVSLPEGKWKLEFQEFDDASLKIYPQIIGQTPYFEIDNQAKAETIHVSLSKPLSFNAGK